MTGFDRGVPDGVSLLTAADVDDIVSAALQRKTEHIVQALYAEACDQDRRAGCAEGEESAHLWAIARALSSLAERLASPAAPLTPAPVPIPTSPAIRPGDIWELKNGEDSVLVTGTSGQWVYCMPLRYGYDAADRDVMLESDGPCVVLTDQEQLVKDRRLLVLRDRIAPERAQELREWAAGTGELRTFTAGHGERDTDQQAEVMRWGFRVTGATAEEADLLAAAELARQWDSGAGVQQ